MHILQQEKLTRAQKNDLLDLAADCRAAEPISLSIPEDASRCLLLYDGPAGEEERYLAACLLICEAPDAVWECYAFTRPESRKKGFFSRLIQEARHLAKEQEAVLGHPIDLAFLSDQKSPQGLAAAKALGMTLWYAEYRMERKLDSPDIQKSLSPAEKPCLILRRQRIQEELDAQDGEAVESWLYSAYPLPDTGSAPPSGTKAAAADQVPCPQAAIGSCRLLPFGPSSYYLYHVEIRPDMRSKGWGKALLTALLQQLPPDSRIALQVSSLNAPALALYKKTGFCITETLSYHILI